MNSKHSMAILMRSELKGKAVSRIPTTSSNTPPSATLMDGHKKKTERRDKRHAKHKRFKHEEKSIQLNPIHAKT